MTPRTTDNAPRVAPPRDLTIPDEGSRTARDVLSAAMRRLLGDLRRVAALPGEDPADAQAFAKTLAWALQHAPGAVVSALRLPTAGAPLRCARNVLDGAGDRAQLPAWSRELRASVLADLAAQGALPEPVRLSRPPPRVLSPRARLAAAVPEGSAVTFAPGVLRVGEREVPLRAGDAPDDLITRPYHLIEGEMLLAQADNNPLSMFEAHPDKKGNAIDLGGHPVEEWVDVLRGCLDLTARYMPSLRGEMDLCVHQIVPVGYHDQRHLSASYQESIGTIYMTLHPNPMTMTEALIHEFSHNKINALFELDPVLDNAFWPLYASPVRPDPRPLHGVVLAVHAFQPIARLYEAMTAAGEPVSKSTDFQRRFAQIRKVNRDGAEVVLGHGVPTAVGRGLLDEMRRWDEHFTA
jgi:HEXXH motif-containing protein